MKKLSQKKTVELVSELSGLTKKECRTVMEDYITVIQEGLKAGFEMQLPLLGIFSLKYKSPKEGTFKSNIKTGNIEMTKDKDEYNSPSFRFSKMFRQEIRDLTEGNVIVGKKEEKNEEER